MFFIALRSPWILLPFVLVFGVCASLFMGIPQLSPVDAYPGESLEPVESLRAASVALRDTIIVDIRLPRTLLALLVGAVLAMCGAAMQGLFRNPLADPSLIGVTAGASAGASVMLVVSGAGLANWGGLSLVSLGAFVGGLVAVTLVYQIAVHMGRSSVATMLLAGIAMTAIAGSLTSLLEYMGSNETLRRLSLWRMGGLDGSHYQHVGVASIEPYTISERYKNELMHSKRLWEQQRKKTGFITMVTLSGLHRNQHSIELNAIELTAESIFG